ncbi:MAG: uL15 family ribosomal protein [Candidatus Aenigmatarchaeota archaeon]
MGKEKTRKMRGKKTFGYGSKKKHRGKGSRGGVGFSGSKGHKMQKILKEHPDHFNHMKLKKRKTANAINVGGLEKLAGKEKEKALNLSAMGYDKLLGSGETKFKGKVTIARWSKSAEEKLKAAGCELAEA